MVTEGNMFGLQHATAQGPLVDSIQADVLEFKKLTILSSSLAVDQGQNVFTRVILNGQDQESYCRALRHVFKPIGSPRRSIGPVGNQMPCDQDGVGDESLETNERKVNRTGVSVMLGQTPEVPRVSLPFRERVVQVSGVDYQEPALPEPP